MSYSAIEQMRQYNRSLFGEQAGPLQPQLVSSGKGNDLKSAALRFIHERCEGLCFDETVEQREKDAGFFEGTGLKKGQVPYHLQMDVNRLCLEKAPETLSTPV